MTEGPYDPRRLDDTEYSEQQTEAGTVVRIADPRNDEAWIRSTLTLPVER